MLPVGLLGALLCAGLTLAQNPAPPPEEQQAQAQQEGASPQVATQGPELQPAASEYEKALENIKKLTSDRRYAEAEQAGRVLLAEVEAEFGPESLQVAEVIHAMFEALLRGDRANDPECQALLQRAVAIREKVLGPEHPALSESLCDLGIILREAGDTTRALPLLERAVAITEKVRGSEHPELVRLLRSLAHVHTAMGDDAGAEKILERTLGLAEMVLGKDDIQVAKILNNLAVVRANLEASAPIRPLYQRSLAISEKALGPDHPDVATMMVNLANLHTVSGEFAEATALYERALAIYEKALGPESSWVAWTLTNLGGLYVDMGTYTEGVAVFRRALSAYEKSLGPDHPETGYLVMNLGGALAATGEFAQAKPLLEHALAIAEKTLGPDHPNVAAALDTLGMLHHATGEYEEARRLFERALGNEENAASTADRLFATRHQLSRLLYDMGQYAEARKRVEASLEVLVERQGADHPQVGRTLSLLAVLLLKLGDPRGAFEAALRAEEIGRNYLRLTARSFAERQALAFSTVRSSGLDVALTLAADRDAPQEPRLWDSLIHSRALVLDEMAARHAAVAGADDLEIARLVRELTSARERLAWLAVRGPGETPPEQYRRLLDETREEKEQAERALAEMSAAFRQEQARSRLGLKEVAAALPADGALVAYVKYGRHEFGQKPAGKPPEPVPSYLAFVLKAGASDPAIAPLGAAKEIDALVNRWRAQMEAEASSAGRASKRAEAAYRSLAAKLQHRVWNPIAMHLDGAQQVFIVPDGALNLVNFAALPVGQTQYLAEAGPLIHYLSAERDLVPVETTRDNRALLALGAPAFDETGVFAALAPQPQEGAAAPVLLASAQAYRGPRSACGSFETMRFEPLPASAREVEDVADLWQQASDTGSRERAVLRGTAAEAISDVVSLSGAAASEAAFKQLAPGRRVLHLATHGFFLAGQCSSALDSPADPTRGVAPASVTGENPLLLSGLVLAGANHRQAARPEEDDGVLTAEEIAALDLRGTEWAVLSACDTGVGEVKAGEGVFGLRRAFQVAGARTVIMSLWPVEDEATREWMRNLYSGRFLEGLSTAEAVRSASLKLLRERRAQKLSTHPFYWAGFVAAGDWR
jgi:CHAT domain-containing protein